MPSPIPTMPSNYGSGITYFRPNVSSPQPAAKASEGFLDRLSSEKDKFAQYFGSLVSRVDKNALVVGVSLATTVALGGAFAYYFHKKRAHQLKESKAAKTKVAFNIDETSSPVKIENTIKTPAPEEGDAKQPGVLVLHQCPRGRRTPCIAPYPLKLETFLRVHGINYEVPNMLLSEIIG